MTTRESVPLAAVAKLVKERLPATVRPSNEALQIVQACLDGAPYT